MTIDLSNHPCFNRSARHSYGRIHLPVAPQCNVQCVFCNRLYDCVNESRPGVSSVVLKPAQAIHYLDKMLAQDPRIQVMGIAGPGDPFSNPVETMETLSLARKRFPELMLCVASNGWQIGPHISGLKNLGLGHVTLTINMVDPEIGARLYPWVREGRVIYRGIQAALLLHQRQMRAIELLKEAGILVKINSIVIPGINDRHIIEVARETARQGADLFNPIPVYPVAGAILENPVEPSAAEMHSIREEISHYMPLMSHCTRCRADAVGLLDESLPAAKIAALKEAARWRESGNSAKPYFAVTSQEGMLVNQHLGEADRVLIYDFRNGRARLLETRQAPLPGGGEQRWQELAKTLNDCQALLTGAIGNNPKRVLEQNGMRVLCVEGLIEEVLMFVTCGEETRVQIREKTACGVGCQGTGLGCA